MTGNSTFIAAGTHTKQVHYSPNLLSTVHNAVDHKRVVYIEYESMEKGVSKREIEPMALIYKHGKRHLVGWCRLRKDYRSFRLDRLNIIKIKNEEFIKRHDFNVNQFQDEPGTQYHEEYEDHH